MKLFLIFCFAFLFLAAKAIGYDAYRFLAAKKQWPDTIDAFQVFNEYCNDKTSSPPSMLPGLSRNDCDAYISTKPPLPIQIETTTSFPLRIKDNRDECPEYTTAYTPPKTSFRETTADQTQTSTETSTTNSQSSSTSYPLTIKENKVSCPASAITSTKPSFQETTQSVSKEIFSKTTLSHSDSATTSNNVFTRTVTDATSIATTTPTNPFKTSLANVESSLSQTSTTTFGASSNVKSSKLAESTLTTADTKSTTIKMTHEASTSFSTGSLTTLKETPGRQPFSPSTQITSPPSTPAPKFSPQEPPFSEKDSTVSDKFKITTSVLDTTGTLFTSKKSTTPTESSAVFTNAPDKTETTKSITFETSKTVSEPKKTTTLIQSPLTLQISTTPFPSSVLPTNANKRSTVFDDEISSAAVTGAYTSTTTSTPSTSATMKPASVTIQVTKSYIDETSRVSFINEVTATQSNTAESQRSQALTSTTPSYPTTSSSDTRIYTTTTQTPTTTATVMETSTVTTFEITQTLSQTSEIPSTQEVETTTTKAHTTVTPSVPTTQTTSFAIKEDLQTFSPTSDITSTQVHETTTAKAHVTVTPSIPTTQTTTFSIFESSPFVNPLLHTTTSSAPTVTESKIATRPTKSGTYTAKLTKTTSITTVKETTEDKKSTQKLIDETFTSLVTSPSKRQSTTGPQTVTEEQETTTAINVASEIAPLTKEKVTSTKLSTQETTVSTTSSFSTTEVSDNKQITETPTKQSDLIATTDASSSSHVTIKLTTTLEQILASLTVKAYSTSIPTTPSSTLTTSTTESPQTISATSTPPPPTKEPVDCTMPCPDEFFEGDYACFKFIQPKDGKAWKYSDFKTACNSMNGVISSLSDFEYVKNMELFKRIALSKQINITSVFINTVPTPNIAARRVINGIDLAKSNSTKISNIQLSSGKKYPNSTAVCRVGKFCEEYTCPIREFFLVESARYFETAAPLTKVLKAGDSLNVECVGNPKKTFQLECDRRGYLIPDSSMLKCEGSGIKSEVVKSCGECDIQQTESCQDLQNGSFSCNCKQSYFGQTCKNIVDACSNYTCKNGGTCINEFLNAKCKCQTSHFGDRCQYDFYKSEGPARVMRALTNAAVVIVIIDEVVRTRQKHIIPASGKTGTLPTEVCRFYTTMMGAMAFLMKILWEFPESGKMEEKYYCQTHFEITITFVFLSLSGMLAESVISFGVITNKWTNQFKGRCKDRKNCISVGKLFICISTIAIIPTAIIWQNSSLLVTPRSCIGTLPWENASDQKQMAAMLLVVLMTFYATTASCIALFARQFIDQNNLETRRRYDCDRTNPLAYGREILPIEINVRYYLLALRPILFALNWFWLIASTELMVEWVSGVSTFVGLSYSVVNFLQNNFAFKKDLEGWIYTAMGWLPKKYSPKINRVSLHSRKDYLKIYDPEALEAEEAKLIEQRDQYLRSKYPVDRDFEEAKVAWTGAAEVRYPIIYEQPIEHLMLADRNRWLNATALRIMMPAGLRAVIQKQWTLIYLRARAAGRTRSGAMAAIFKQLQPPRLFTYGYRRSIFNGMFKVFWQNMTIVDQLDGVEAHLREKAIEVFQKGVQMLTIKPNRQIELAEIWDLEHSDGRTLTFKRDDPLMNTDQQQKIYDMLEELCNSITSEMMEQDEAISRALFEGDPERYGIRQDILTEIVFNDYPTSLMDFMLNEQRPNFIGPRTIENVLAPGVDHLQHTAWFWMIHNGLMWQRVTTQAKYLAFFVQIKKDNAEIIKNNNSWRNYFPFNWFNKNENVQQQANPEPEDDLHVEDPIGLN